MDTTFRDYVARLLDWEEAHAGFAAAVDGLPQPLRGRTPEGLPYSPWQLVEHLRITQHDILDFCVNPAYQGAGLAEGLLAALGHPAVARRVGRESAPVRRGHGGGPAARARPRGGSQRPDSARQRADLFPGLLLVADHTAYHIGELIVVRRLLGAWPKR